LVPGQVMESQWECAGEALLFAHVSFHAHGDAHVFSMPHKASILTGDFIAGVLQAPNLAQQPPDISCRSDQAGIRSVAVDRMAKFHRQPPRPDLLYFFESHCPEGGRQSTSRCGRVQFNAEPPKIRVSADFHNPWCRWLQNCQPTQDNSAEFVSRRLCTTAG